MNRRLALALDYLDYGYNPIPVYQGKEAVPACKWKEFQTRWVTREEVTAWWSAHPEWNIALVCGVFTGLVAVDADSEEAVTYCGIHLDQTPVRNCSKRGKHLFYRHPGVGIYVTTLAGVHPNLPIDIRGDGGLIKGIGSIHWSGIPYVLDEGSDLVPPASLPVFQPAWFPPPKRLDAPKPVAIYHGNADALLRAERYLAACSGADQGCRNASTYRVAAAVVRDFNLPFETGLTLMAHWNELRNNPPLPFPELEGIVRSSLQSGRNPVGSRLTEYSPIQGQR